MARRLSAHERALWSRVAASVRPLPGKAAVAPPASPPPTPRADPPSQRAPTPPPRPLYEGRQPAGVAAATLDGGWDRKLGRGDVAPDRVIDLHGHTVDAAYRVLTEALDRAASAGERIILVITGKGSGERPGRIRAELAHWLDRGEHRGRVAALRPAHPRHGGGGAFYLILRRR